MKLFKKLIPMMIFLGAMASLSSCNRGVGCPSDFSLGETVETLVDVLPMLLLSE